VREGAGGSACSAGERGEYTGGCARHPLEPLVHLKTRTALVISTDPLTPPRSVDVGRRDEETVSEVEEECQWQTLGEHIG